MVAPTVEQVCLVVHARAGMGDHAAVMRTMVRTLRADLGRRIRVRLAMAESHAEVMARVRSLVRAATGPTLLVAGGGSGTLRCVVEGAEAERGPSVPQMVFSALRLGSGNVVARRAGMPQDPASAAHALAQGISNGVITQLPLMRVGTQDPRGCLVERTATTLVGLGQLGRVPRDLVRWRGRLPTFHAAAAAAFGLETVNQAQYHAGFAWRLMWVRHAALECVEVQVGTQVRRGRLLAGAFMNAPVPGLPVPNLQPGQTALCIAMDEAGGNRASRLPWRVAQRAHAMVVPPGGSATVTLLDRGCATAFIDEDPFVFHRALTLAATHSVGWIAPVQATHTEVKP